MSDIANVLRSARALIANKEQWTKGTYDDGDGHRCAVGALRAAAVSNHADRVDVSYITDNPYYEAVRGALPESFKEIETFNDTNGISHGDVLKLFDKAICEAEQAE